MTKDKCAWCGEEFKPGETITNVNDNDKICEACEGKSHECTRCGKVIPDDEGDYCDVCASHMFG